MIPRVVTTPPVLPTRLRAYLARMILRRRLSKYGTDTRTRARKNTHTHTRQASSLGMLVYQIGQRHKCDTNATTSDNRRRSCANNINETPHDVTAELYFVLISYFGILILHVGCAKLNVFCSAFTRCNVCTVCLCFKGVSLQFCNGACRMLHVGAKVHRAFK